MKAEYIWIDGNNNLRSKTKILNQEIKNTLNIEDSKSSILNQEIKNTLNIEDLEEWNFDGSSTNQATTDNSEIILKPVKIFNDPFDNSNNNNILVLCETYLPNGKPHSSNTRYIARKVFNIYSVILEPWFGIEQEFFLFNNNTKLPCGFPLNGYPKAQGDYYCSVGGNNAYGREFLISAENNCLNAGLSLTGKNFEVACGQMEIQIKAIGLDAADQLIILRYILHRTSELYNTYIDFSTKPISGDWNGSGCHFNFSTIKMREENGYEYILKSINNLSINHMNDIIYYGEGNKERLTGKHETSSIDTFNYGVANRSASVRIPTTTFKNKKGYFEDRRPSSCCDPYKVSTILLESCL